AVVGQYLHLIMRKRDGEHRIDFLTVPLTVCWLASSLTCGARARRAGCSVVAIRNIEDRDARESSDQRVAGRSVDSPQSVSYAVDRLEIDQRRCSHGSLNYRINVR